MKERQPLPTKTHLHIQGGPKK